MERASLRPVPSRPRGPVAPAEAVSFVSAELPALDDAAAAAFALVALVGRPRPEVAASADSAAAAGLSDEPLAEALARARKALRRKLHPLPGSGWCERAERLISDQLDDALVDPGPARLEVHLANCDRCVEHGRRLGQAQDALVADFERANSKDGADGEGPPAPPEVGPAAEPPALRVVEPLILPAPRLQPDALPAAGTSGELPAASEGPGAGQEGLPAPTPEPSDGEPVEAEVPEATDPAPAPGPPAPTPPVPPVPASARSPVAYPPPPRPAPWSPPARPAPAPGAWTSLAPAAQTTPAPAAWSAPAPAPWTPAAPGPAANAWQAAPPRPLAARASLQTEDTWTSIGPLVAVLFVAVVVFVLVGLLTL